MEGMVGVRRRGPGTAGQATAPPAPAAPPQAAAAAAAAPSWGWLVQSLSRWMFLYFVLQFLRSHFVPPPATSGEGSPSSFPPLEGNHHHHHHAALPSSAASSNTGGGGGGGGGGPASTTHASDTYSPGGGAGRTYIPLWRLGQRTDLYCYLSTEPVFRDFGNHEALVWRELDLVFGDATQASRAREVEVPVPASVQNNGTWYAHIYWTKRAVPPGTLLMAPGSGNADPHAVMYYRKPLARFLPQRRVHRRKHLLSQGTRDVPAPSSSPSPSPVTSSSAGSAEHEDGTVPIVSHLWPNISMHVVAMQDPLPPKLPPLLFRHILVNPETGTYAPIFYASDFWMLQEHIMPLNESVRTVNLSFSLQTIPFWQYTLYTQFDESFRIQHTMLGVESSETDELKRMFLETNPLLLAITFLVSLLHSLFDFLAFKNDVEFWRKRKAMEGLSFRSLLLNIAFQLVIFLYLLDNETSWMILISNGVGLIIELWKVQRTVHVVVGACDVRVARSMLGRVRGPSPRSRSISPLFHPRTQITADQLQPTFPFLALVDKVKPSKLVSKTKEYDAQAFRYLSYFLYPALVAYTAYSLLYEQHKSWYSFVLGTLVGFVYAFGFVAMTPQLFINWRLKSVAHMPWKTFMYKALNTFVDDLFAFVIKMPWLHRLACLRDDAVFLVYLYQRWIYPEDKRRRNEFGQVGEDDEGEGEEDEGEEKGGATDKPVEGMGQESGDKQGVPGAALGEHVPLVPNAPASAALPPKTTAAARRNVLA